MSVLTSKTKVVIVEDNEMDSTLLESKLKEKTDYETVVYTSFDPLFRFLEAKGDVDVVILDDEMPGIKAVDTVEKIRKKSPLTEVIVLCKNGDDAYHNRLRSAGAFNYVKKDRAGIDKIVAYIETIKKTMLLRRENLSLKTKAKKSGTLGLIVGIIILVAIAAAIYIMTQ